MKPLIRCACSWSSAKLPKWAGGQREQERAAGAVGLITASHPTVIVQLERFRRRATSMTPATRRRDVDVGSGTSIAETRTCGAGLTLALVPDQAVPLTGELNIAKRQERSSRLYQ